MKKHTSSTGRLTQPLHPKAHAIAFPAKEKSVLINEFEILSTLNEAHLVALFKSKLIPLKSTQKILHLIAHLRKNNFSLLLTKKLERGSYLLFENYLTEKLGMKVAGSLHIGRSRNDINATSFKLDLRNSFKSIFQNLCKLRVTLLKQAKRYSNVAMPIYSQYQVAQVGSYSYYLLAIEEALARDQHSLKELFFSLDECPIGAAAGCGSSFPIDVQLIARLLGFSHTSHNALDAVADRDLGLRILSTLAITATHLSRIAQDYQIWTTQEFSFFELPDSLCGSSSMMPQKKNPYLFELIKGKASALNGALMQALTSMHNVPFTNSVEVGTESLQRLSHVLKDMHDILTLADLLIEQAFPLVENMSRSIHQGLAIATGIAEMLVKEKKLPFRQVHYEIGSQITTATNSNIDPIDQILKHFKFLPQKYQDIDWAHLNEYGNGPGKRSVQNSFQNAKHRLDKDKLWLKQTDKYWIATSKKLQREIKCILDTI